MKLNELNINEYAKIKAIGGEGSTRHHLLDMGLIPDAIIRINKYAPMGDPIEVFIHGYNLTLRLSEAQTIEVEKVSNDIKFLTCCNDCKSCKNCKELKNQKENPYCKKCKVNKKETLHPGLGESGKFHDKNSEKPLPSNTTLSFALLGNPNTGKTTLFNQLTGSNAHIGNFPGVTVDKKSGQIVGKSNTIITDLPGIYSLSPYSNEEKVSKDFILKEKPNCIINIVDANSIERNLGLTLQLIELDIPTVLAINMMDELIADGGNIDINLFEERLGIPVVPISALNGSGVNELIDHALHIAKYQEKPKIFDFCTPTDHGGAVHRAIHSIMHLIEDHCEKYSIPKRYAATKIIEDDKSLIKELNLSSNESETIDHIIKEMETERGLDRITAIADMRFSFINKICFGVVTKPDISSGVEASNAVDRFLTGKYTGIPLFIIIMGLIFYITFNLIGPFLQGLLNDFISYLTNICDTFLTNIQVSDTLHSLIIDGIFAGVGSVLSFIPIILVLFLFLSLLEDSGYMARVAFVMDKLLRKLGLSGRSIVPLIIGFGCTVPGVMATRTIPSDRDRKLTILLLPFMTCTAKLPIYGFFANAFFPKYAGFIMIGLYVFTMIVGIVFALLTKKTFFRGEPVPFIMELPAYRLPSPINVIKLLWEKAKDFLEKAFTIIFVATIVIWLMQHFTFRFEIVKNADISMLSQISGFIAPIFAPMGLNDYRIITSLISGFLAKESVVSTLTILFGNLETLLSSITARSAIALLVFSSLYTPCVASIAAIKRELGYKFAIFVLVFQCILAYILSFLSYYIIGFFI